MVTWVIGINCITALVLLWTAWRLWQLQQTLVKVNRQLQVIESDARRSLTGAQSSLLNGQQGLQKLGLQYRQTGQQLKQVRQLLLLLGWMQGYVRKPQREEPRREKP